MLDINSDSDGISDFLLCLSGLEIKNSKLFRILAEKIVFNSVKKPLSKIAVDNEKQAIILKDISRQIGNPKVKTKECKKKLSVVCKNTETILKIIKEKEKISINELLKYLEILESSGGAAQYLLVQAETFLFMSDTLSKFYGNGSKKFNDIINEMVQNIEDNIILLENIKKTIQQEINKKNKNAPIFKYKTPDAWFIPSHTQKHEI